MSLIVLLALFLLGQVGRISIFNFQINFYLYEIVLVVFLLISILRHRFAPVTNYFRENKWLYLFILSLVVSLIVNSNLYTQYQSSVAALYLLRLVSYFLLFIYSYPYLNRYPRVRYERNILVFSGILAVTCVVQYFLYPNLRNLYYLGWDPHQYRLFGSFLEPSILASILGLLSIYLFLHSYREKIARPLLVVLGGLGLLTYSRGFYLAAVLTIMLFFIKEKLYKQILIFVVLFVLALFLLPKPFGEGVNLLRTMTIESRMKDYSRAVELWKKRPVFGIGYNYLPFVKNNQPRELKTPDHAASAFHSSFLTILSTAGLLGLSLFILTLINFASISKITFYSTIFLSIFSFTDNVILHPFVLFFYLFLLAGELFIFRKSQ